MKGRHSAIRSIATPARGFRPAAPGGRIRRWTRRLLLLAGTLVLLPTAVILVYTIADPPLTPLMVLRRSQGETLIYRWRPLAQVSPNLRSAVIAAEDNLFCRHFGFDTGAIEDELEILLAGGRSRGASTITMQTAKNILLWPGRDPLRKLIEAWMTPQIELLWTKQRILEVYLNIIETGPGIYGAEAAARTFFGKPAANLTAWESALIAAALPNPRQWSVARPDARLERRARIIARRVPKLGDLGDCAATPASAS